MEQENQRAKTAPKHDEWMSNQQKLRATLRAKGTGKRYRRGYELTQVKSGLRWFVNWLLRPAIKHPHTRENARRRRQLECGHIQLYGQRTVEIATPGLFEGK